MKNERSIKLKGRYYRNYPPSNPLGHAKDELALRPDNTVFLLVDVYGKAFDEDRDLGDAPEFYKRSAEVVETNRNIVVNHIKPAKEAAKRLGLPIIYLTNYLSPALNEHHEWRNMSLRTVNVDVLEAWQEPNDILAFSEVIAPEEDDYLIKKQFYSGFFETHLHSLLCSLGTRNIVTVGFDSRICLGTTVVDAMYRSYRVIVLRDCVRTSEYVETKEEGWANWIAIRFIETNVGYTSTSADFIQACSALSGSG